MHPTPDPSPIALSAPIGRLMRPTLSVTAGDSIERAVGELRRNGGILPVVEEARLIGVITEQSLTTTLAAGLPLTAACSEAAGEGLTIAPYASGSEALRMFSGNGGQTFVVVDDHERVMGLISPSDLYPRRRTRPNLGSVGGMATPFGVYLTNGGVRGGASLLAVMSTGAAMLTVLWLSSMAMTPVADIVDKALHYHGRDLVDKVLLLIPFAIAMRFSPLAGTHGAEHMVVHAIERGEELVPEVVARMPRVHPRCGTNLVVAASIFGAIEGTHWTADGDVRFLAAVLATLFLWKPLGSFAQQYITTRKPSAAQIQSGIKAADDLIRNYSTAHSVTVSVPQRIWNSGMLQVMAGSTATVLLIQGVCWVFHINLPGAI